MCQNVSYNLPSNNFTMISNNVTLDTTLHPYAYKIFSLIIQEVTKQGTFYKQTIANRFGHCKNTFDKYWKQLKDKGYLIQVKKRDSKSHWTYEYTINSQPDQTQETLKNQQSFHTPKNEGLQEGAYSKTQSSNTYYSSSSKQPATPITDDRNSLLLKELSSRNISISKTSLTELSALIDTYGNDYISCIIDYCVDRGAKTYGYIKNTLKALMNKNIYTVEAFKESVRQHEEKKIKNRQLKEQRLEQSNLEMTKKLAYAPKTSNTTNAPKKTNFNTMDSREWDFDELDRLEDEYIDNRVKAIEAKKAKEEAQKLYDSITELSNRKKALEDNYLNGDIEEQEFEKAMKEIDIELAELSKQQASINL